MGPRWAQNGAGDNEKIQQDTLWSPLGVILGYIGPSVSFLEGPKGPLEENLGLRRAAVGMICGKKVGLQTLSKT